MGAGRPKIALSETAPGGDTTESVKCRILENSRLYQTCEFHSGSFAIHRRQGTPSSVVVSSHFVHFPCGSARTGGGTHQGSRVGSNILVVKTGRGGEGELAGGVDVVAGTRAVEGEISL